MSLEIKSIKPNEKLIIRGEYTVTESDITSDTLTNIITATNEKIGSKTSQAVAQITSELKPIPTSPDAFNNTSWAYIKEMADACVTDGIGDYQHMLGYTKNFNVDGFGEVGAQLVAFNHNQTADGKTIGFTFMLDRATSVVEFSGTSQSAGNKNYKDSLLRTTINNDLVNKYPSELLDVITAAHVKYLTQYQTPGSSYTYAYVDDKLWTPSYIELFNDKQYGEDGTVLLYFLENNNDNSRKRLNSFNNYGYNLRTIQSFGTINTAYVTTDGKLSWFNGYTKCGIVPCFCI